MSVDTRKTEEFVAACKRLGVDWMALDGVALLGQRSGARWAKVGRSGDGREHHYPLLPDFSDELTLLALPIACVRKGWVDPTLVCVPAKDGLWTVPIQRGPLVMPTSGAYGVTDFDACLIALRAVPESVTP